MTMSGVNGLFDGKQRDRVHGAIGSGSLRQDGERRGRYRFDPICPICTNSRKLCVPREQPEIVRERLRKSAPLTGATPVQRHVTWSLSGALAGLMLALGFRVMNPLASLGEVILLGLTPMLVAGILINRNLRLESQQREVLIQEQITFVESRHEELREAYLAQELTRVELRRKVVQLTALQRAGLLFSSTLDREALMQKVLEALTSDLQYDRAVILFFDPVRQVVMDTRVLGVSPEIQAFVRTREIPVTDPMSSEGIVLLQGQPLLVGDVQAVWDRLHPLNQRFALLTQTKAWVAVPLKVKDRVLGSLMVDRIQAHSLTQDDLELMMTVGPIKWRSHWITPLRMNRLRT